MKQSLIITETGLTRDINFNELDDLFTQSKNPVEMVMELEIFTSLKGNHFIVYGIDDLNYSFNTLDLPRVDATGELIIVSVDKNFKYIDVDWEEFYETYLEVMETTWREENEKIKDVKFLEDYVMETIPLN